jgi:hypothetical protein
MIYRMRTPEKVLAAFTLLLAIVSAGRFVLLRTRGVDGPWSRAATFAPMGDDYVPVRWPQPDRIGADWTEPVRQLSGAWNYQLFSAPDIFFDANAGGFTTFRPAPSEDAIERSGEADETAIASRSQAKPVPYLLQLVGYAGAKGRLLGIFENVATGETLVAGEGKVLASLGLVVERVLVSPATAISAAGESLANVATVVLRDETRHERVTLTNAARLFVSAPEAQKAVVAARSVADEEVGADVPASIESRDSARLAPQDTPKLSVERHDGLPAAAQPKPFLPPTA